MHLGGVPDVARHLRSKGGGFGVGLPVVFEVLVEVEAGAESGNPGLGQLSGVLDVFFRATGLFLGETRDAIVDQREGDFLTIWSGSSVMEKGGVRWLERLRSLSMAVPRWAQCWARRAMGPAGRVGHCQHVKGLALLWAPLGMGMVLTAAGRNMPFLSSGW